MNREQDGQEREEETHPQPVGVDTPKKQSPSTLDTTWSFIMGVMMTPALAREEAQIARRNVVAFIFVSLPCLCVCLSLSLSSLFLSYFFFLQ